MFLSVSALGQETGLGLDLTQPASTDDKPGPTSLGLDLSDPNDLRPSVAIVGLAPPFVRDSALATRLATSIENAARTSGNFSSVITAQQARAKLGSNYANALSCASAECLEQIAQQLRVDRVITGQITYGKEQTLLKLEGLSGDHGPATIVEMTPASTGHAVQSNALEAGGALLKQLGRRQSRLKVKTSVEAAVVSLGDRELGSGSLDAKVAPGRYVLRVTAGPGYQAFEREVTLEPGATLEITAALSEQQPTKVKIADGIVDTDLPFVSRPKPSAAPTSGTEWFKRPGLYIGAAGLVAIGAGAGVGILSQGVVSRAKTVDNYNGGILGVSRAEVLAAKNEAMLANVLMAAGSAMVVGGGLWFILTPSPPPASVPVASVDSSNARLGWIAAVGGTF